MKIKEGFILRKVADTYAAIPIGDKSCEFNGVITLNKSGAFLWEQMKEDVTEEQVLKAVLEHYKVERERALLCIRRFIVNLQEAQLLEAEQ